MKRNHTHETKKTTTTNATKKNRTSKTFEFVMELEEMRAKKKM